VAIFIVVLAYRNGITGRPDADAAP
jgi:hypothetical protein